MDISQANEIIVKLEGTQGLQGPRGDYPYAPKDLGAAAVYDPNCGDSTYFRLTPTQDFIINPPLNPVDGIKVLFEITQDATGNRQVTFDTDFEMGPFTIVLSATPFAVDMIGVVFNEDRNLWYVLAFARGY